MSKICTKIEKYDILENQISFDYSQFVNQIWKIEADPQKDAADELFLSMLHLIAGKTN